MIYEREGDNKEGDMDQEHPFPMVLGYQRGSDIREVKVYLISVWLGEYQRSNTIK